MIGLFIFEFIILIFLVVEYDLFKGGHHMKKYLILQISAFTVGLNTLLITYGNLILSLFNLVETSLTILITALLYRAIISMLFDGYSKIINLFIYLVLFLHLITNIGILYIVYLT